MGGGSTGDQGGSNNSGVCKNPLLPSLGRSVRCGVRTPPFDLEKKDVAESVSVGVYPAISGRSGSPRIIPENEAKATEGGMKLSIITVNLNNEIGLEKTLKSVFEKQGGFSNFEQIVVDGGSTDDSVAVIKKYADQIVFWVSEPDGGIYNAMNKGVSKATGEYLLFLNSGDWLSDDVLGRAVPLLNGTDIVYGDQIVHENGKFSVWIIPGEAELTETFFARDTLSHPSSFIKATLLGVLRYDEHYSIIADQVFFYHALMRGSTFKKIDLKFSVFDRGGVSTRPATAALHLAERERFMAEAFGIKAVPFIRDSVLLTHILGAPPEFTPLKKESIQVLRRWVGLFYFLDRTSVLKWIPQAVAAFMNWVEHRPSKIK